MALLTRDHTQEKEHLSDTVQRLAERQTAGDLTHPEVAAEKRRIMEESGNPTAAEHYLHELALQEGAEAPRVLRDIVRAAVVLAALGALILLAWGLVS